MQHYYNTFIERYHELDEHDAIKRKLEKLPIYQSITELDNLMKESLRGDYNDFTILL